MQHRRTLRRRHHHDDGQIILDESDRPVLELARGEALCVHIGQFLELERAFERDRVPHVTAQEQHGLR